MFNINPYKLIKIIERMGWFDFKEARTPSQSEKAKALLSNNKRSEELVKAIQANHLDQQNPKVGPYRVSRVGQTKRQK